MDCIALVAFSCLMVSGYIAARTNRVKTMTVRPKLLKRNLDKTTRTLTSGATIYRSQTFKLYLPRNYLIVNCLKDPLDTSTPYKASLSVCT